LWFYQKNINKIYDILKKTLEMLARIVYNIDCSSAEKT
jgi:hypothetical protein